MATTDARTMPHDLQAEAAVLGAALVENRSWVDAKAVVSASDFYRRAHQQLFDAIDAVSSRGEPMDLLTVRAELVRRDWLADVGETTLYALVDGVPRTTNVRYYAKIVREKSILRALIKRASGIVEQAYDAAKPADELLDEAEAAIMEVGATIETGEFVLAAPWMDEMRQIVATAEAERRVITGVPTGLPTLDSMTRGLQQSDLVFIGARPSVGKTSLMLQIAMEASRHVMAGIVSIEMPRRSIGMRALSMESRVDAYRLMTGYVSRSESQAVAEAADRLSQMALAIDDAPSQSPAQLRAKVRRFASQYGLGICFIDYMQLLRGDGKASQNRNEEISIISQSLKALARELEIPVVVLSQLSRASEQRGGSRRPQMWDLRDSGSLEADADVVLLLHRPQQHDEDRGVQHYTDGEEAQIIVAKQRNGPTGTIKLRFVSSLMRFAEMDSRHTEAA